MRDFFISWVIGWVVFTFGDVTTLPLALNFLFRSIVVLICVMSLLLALPKNTIFAQ